MVQQHQQPLVWARMCIFFVFKTEISFSLFAFFLILIGSCSRTRALVGCRIEQVFTCLRTHTRTHTRTHRRTHTRTYTHMWRVLAVVSFGLPSISLLPPSSSAWVPPSCHTETKAHNSKLRSNNNSASAKCSIKQLKNCQHQLLYAIAWSPTPRWVNIWNVQFVQ